MSNLAIRVENLGKMYHIGGPQRHYDRLGDRLADMALAPFRRALRLFRGQASSAAGLDQEIWALKSISFEVQEGEVLGIIGRNGAGKSTLLKLLSRITDPTEGLADINGRVGSLLEVGTGFHPELTGRENIFLNGAILGMKKKEIERKFDEITAFAEIDKFMETPVKHYSSGMYVRLAFSVAAHLEPEILLVDEVLAVGDIAFQRKCLGKMGDVAQQGRTVLFVSHNMGLIQTLCQRGILLQDGRIASDGPIAETLTAYQRTLESAESEDLAIRTDRRGKGRVRLVNVDILDGNDDPAPVLVTGGPARFVFHVSGLINGLSCVFTLVNQLGQRIVNFKSDTPGPADATCPEMGAKFICEVSPLLLMPGRYRLNVLLRGGGEWQDYVEAAKIFDVEGGSLDGRRVKANYEISVCIPHRWTLPQ